MKDQGRDEMIVTGYRGLDDEHHMQIDLLAALRRGIADDIDRGEMDEIFDRLIDYTRVHFSSEQLLMRLYQYPAYQDHLDDHERTVERLQDLHRAFLAGDRVLALDTVDELGDWLGSHIRTADRALGQYLVRLGVGPG